MYCTHQQCLVIRIDVLQENSPVQSLLLYLWIFSQNLTHVSYDILHAERYDSLNPVRIVGKIDQ